MASAAGGNGRPAGGMVVDEMARIRDLVARLESLLAEKLSSDPATRAAFDELTGAISRTFSLLDAGSGALRLAQGPDAGIDVVSPAGKRKFAQLLGDGNPRGGGGGGGRRIRPKPASLVRVTAKTLDDGRTWRKYGQKDIQTHKHPRSYFRCTHKNDQGCKAIRQVQLSEDDASTYVITYMGEHTCKDPATAPRFAPPSNLDHVSRLISFATDATIPNPFLSMKKESDDEVLSNISAYGSSSSDFCAQATAEASTAISTPATAPMSDHGDVSSGLLSPESNLDVDFMEDLDFDLSILSEFF